jgi:hypothetical protein
MMKRILAFCVVVLMVACSKDKYETKPTLKIKETNGNMIPVNGTLKVTLEYTDKEGDVTDSVIVVRTRLNKKNNAIAPVAPYPIPSFPGATKAEIDVYLEYQFGLVFGLPPINIPGTTPQAYETDTLDIKFVVRDKEGNKSDTATTRVYVQR